jgi:hypothetical protein
MEVTVRGVVVSEELEGLLLQLSRVEEVSLLIRSIEVRIV